MNKRELPNELATVKPGDFVLLHYRENAPLQVEKVLRVDEKRIYVQNTTNWREGYRKSDGCKERAWSWARIVGIASPEEIETQVNSDRIKREKLAEENARRERTEYRNASTILASDEDELVSKVPHELLAQVAEALRK